MKQISVRVGNGVRAHSKAKRSRRRIGVGVGAALGAALTAGRAGAGPVTVIATEGQQALGEPSGLKYVSFGLASIGPDGGITFNAVVDHFPIITGVLPTQAAYIKPDGAALQVVGIQGGPAQGVAGGATFSNVNVTELGLGGVGTGVMTINGSTFTSSAIFGGTAGSWTAYAYQGLTAPGTGGDTYSGFFYSPSVNASGQVAFSGHLTNALGGVFVASGGTVSAVAVSGGATPGLAGGKFYDILSAPTISDSGQVSFVALTQGGMYGGIGVWSGAPGSLQLMGAQAAQAPGLPAGVGFSTVSSATPAANRLGQIAFEGTLMHVGAVTSANDSGIWSNIGGGPVVNVARAGDQAPGMPAGTTFGNFSSGATVLNDVGEIALAAPVKSGTNTHSAIFLGRPGALAPIATSDGSQTVTGLPTGYTITGLGSLSLNDAGQVVFSGYVSPAGSTTQRLALFTYDPVAGLQAVAVQGVTLAGVGSAPSSVSIQGQNGGYQPPSVSNNGKYVFLATFPDGNRVLEGSIVAGGQTFNRGPLSNLNRMDLSNGNTLSVTGDLTNGGLFTTGYQPGGSNAVHVSGTLDNGGTVHLQGSGDVVTASSLRNAGAVTLDGGTALHVGSGGFAATGGYQQSADGTLEEVIGGSSAYGVLTVAGAAALGGALDVTLANGFTPAQGETFTFVVASPGQLSGTFQAVNGVPFDGGQWQVAYDDATGTATLTAIPEPGLIAACGVGVLVLSRRVRRAGQRVKTRATSRAM